MKKLLLASLITSASFAATADVVTFNDSSFNGTPGSEVVFDFIDFDADLAQVTQTDTDGNGLLGGGAEAFSEFGSTDIVNFKLGSALLGVDAAYEVFYNYAFSGTATATAAGNLEVNFNAGASGLYVDTTNVGNGMFDGGVQIASFGLNQGACTIDIKPGPLQNKGFCGLDLSLNFAAGYFFNTNGDDLSTTPGAKTATLIVTVQDILGLSQTYPAAGGTQNFQISHDGNMTLSVPEPASVAILGLGLLGFAGARRRKA
ncbi:flocculation-associated PEP-CTERM protein PepA [Pseudocolwellia agarivorans]|uniref:flocculation-associated PEP-CTERM protein PepA n=1 Tax=Pseudocolwellia agarivorans TaxID=1911682 RepID=UPI0009858436|nr:flocculation-associated PEP-CTERM protein PepA [Pseudocolwellia agarivorans]